MKKAMKAGKMVRITRSPGITAMMAAAHFTPVVVTQKKVSQSHCSCNILRVDFFMRWEMGRHSIFQNHTQFVVPKRIDL